MWEGDRYVGREGEMGGETTLRCPGNGRLWDPRDKLFIKFRQLYSISRLDLFLAMWRLDPVRTYQLIYFFVM